MAYPGGSCRRTSGPFADVANAIDPAPGRLGLEGMQTNRKVTGMKAYHSPCRSKTMLTWVSH